MSSTADVSKPKLRIGRRRDADDAASAAEDADEIRVDFESYPESDPYPYSSAYARRDLSVYVSPIENVESAEGVEIVDGDAEGVIGGVKEDYDKRRIESGSGGEKDEGEYDGDAVFVSGRESNDAPSSHSSSTSSWYITLTYLKNTLTYLKITLIQ